MLPLLTVGSKSVVKRFAISAFLWGPLLLSPWGWAEEVFPIYQRSRTVAWHDAGLPGPAFPAQQAWLWPGNGAGQWFP